MLLLFIALVSAASVSRCSVQNATVCVGPDVSVLEAVNSIDECCTACSRAPQCVFFNYHEGRRLCSLKGPVEALETNTSCVCGGYFPPAPRPPANVTVVLDTKHALWRTSDALSSWLIDASRNRQFFEIDFKDKKLRYLTKELGGRYLRFGGTGNDHLTYEFGESTCHDLPAGEECLNKTTWDALYSLSHNADMKFVFTLNVLKRNMSGGGSPANGMWDPTNARELIRYSKKQGYELFGFALGEEENLFYTGKEMAMYNFAVLNNLLREEYPDVSERPAILGPDPHSFLQDGPEPAKLAWLADFMDTSRRLELPIYAVTHHAYVEMDNASLFSPTKLNVMAAVAAAANRTHAAHLPSSELWISELGPHGGGPAGHCSPTSHRWATFANTAWYLDALGTFAEHGYSVLCRQDFVGADYGLVDCTTRDPLPDYYAALLWGRLVGTSVYSSRVESTAIRHYVFSSKDGNGVVVVLLNLDASQHVEATLASTQTGPYHGSRVEYHLTSGPRGVLGQEVKLNGNLLKLEDDKLPPLPGRHVASHSGPVVLAPHSYAFFVLPELHP